MYIVIVLGVRHGECSPLPEAHCEVIVGGTKKKTLSKSNQPNERTGRTVELSERTAAALPEPEHCPNPQCGPKVPTTPQQGGANPNTWSVFSFAFFNHSQRTKSLTPINRSPCRRHLAQPPIPPTSQLSLMLPWPSTPNLLGAIFAVIHLPP